MDDDKPARTDKEILEEARERLKGCIDEYSEERDKQLDDLKFSTLEQWPDEIRRTRENDPNGSRPCLTIDKINQYIAQVVNDFRQNPVSGKVRPVSDDAHEDVADVFQGVIRNIEDHSTASVAYVTAGDWAVRVGEGYYRFVTEYKDEKSFKQKIVIKPVKDAFSVYLGPHSMPDGSDAEFGFILEDLPEDKFKRLYPKAKFTKSDFALDEDGWRDDETLRVAEYFYFDYQKQTIVLMQDGTTLPKKDYDQLPDPKPPTTDSRETNVKTVKWCKLTGIEILDKRDWAGKYIPIVKVIGKEAWVEGKRHCWGLVRPAKDSLRMYNYWASAITEKMALSPKAPFIGAAGQFAGLEEKWKRANVDNMAFLEYNPISVDGLNVPAPQRQQPTPIEAGLMHMFPLIEHDVQTSLGMYKAALGEERPQQSGKAILALTRESDTGTYHFAGNMGISVCHGTRIMIDLIPKIYDTEEVMQMLGEDGQIDQAHVNPQQPQAVVNIQQLDGSIKKIYNLGVGEYGVTVTVGPSYNTRRMENAALFTDLANSAKDPGSAAVLHYLAVKNADFGGGPQAADMLKVLLPAPVIQSMDKTQPPVPPAVAQKMQQLQQALMQAHQENVDLKSGVQETQMKVQAHQQEATQKMQITAKENQDRMALEQNSTASKLALERAIAEEKIKADRQAALIDADLQRWKARLEAETKIVVAQVAAGAEVQGKLLEAEAAADTDIAGKLSGATPFQSLVDAQKEQIGHAQKHTELLGHIANTMQQHMNLTKQVADTSANHMAMSQQALAEAKKPKSIKAVVNGRPLNVQVQ